MKLWNMSTEPISEFAGAPFRLNKYTSRYRFDAILHALEFTDKAPPSLVHRFWEIRDLVAAWNKNMLENFVPSWINCLDEPMSC